MENVSALGIIVSLILLFVVVKLIKKVVMKVAIVAIALIVLSSSTFIATKWDQTADQLSLPNSKTLVDAGKNAYSSAQTWISDEDNQQLITKRLEHWKSLYMKFMALNEKQQLEWLHSTMTDSKIKNYIERVISKPEIGANDVENVLEAFTNSDDFNLLSADKQDFINYWKQSI